MSDESPLKLKNPVSGSYFSEAVKQILIPSRHNNEGVDMPSSPTFIVDPTVNPISPVRMGRPWFNGSPKMLAQAAGQAQGALGLMAAVPTNKIWFVTGWICDYTASATAGNRFLYGSVTDGFSGAVVWIGGLSAAIVANAIGNYDVLFGSGTPNTSVRRTIPGTANTTVAIREVCSVQACSAGSRFIVKDSAAVDAADTFSYAIMGWEYDA